MLELLAINPKNKSIIQYTHKHTHIYYMYAMYFQAFLPHSLQVPATDNKGIARSYLSNDVVCCEIVEVNESSEKLVVGMKGQYYDRFKANNETVEIKFGLIQTSQLPDKYK